MSSEPVRSQIGVFVFNPLSRVNTIGLMVAALSLCLLGVEGAGATWLQRHTVFLLALGVGTFLAALYRRIVVREDSLVTVFGVWPARLRRTIPVSEWIAVVVDAAWAKGGTTYEVSIRWRGRGDGVSSSVLLRGGYAYVETACRLASIFGLPLETTPGFERDAGEEGRRLVFACRIPDADSTLEEGRKRS